MKKILLLAILLTAISAMAGTLSKGQIIVIPVYSHIYTGDNQREFMLTATASFRNADLRTPVTIMSADYYGSDGKLIKRFIKSPVNIAPLSAVRYIINESDKTGGSGASLVITWKSKIQVNQPITGAVMIGAKSQQGISFTSDGTVIKELP